MSKKKALAKFSHEDRLSPAEKQLTRMKLKDIRRACVARGMDFDYAIESTIPQISGWFIENYDRGQNLLLLNEFDAHVEAKLKALKNPDGTNKYKDGDAVFHSALKLGFIGSKDEDGNVTSTKKPRLKALNKQKKAQKERIEGTKVFKGTKKAMTYELTIGGTAFPEIWEKVSKQFPEAQEKSVKIWYKRALKLK
jgi:hypothetical protein